MRDCKSQLHADFERAGWTNKILSQLWPFVNSAVSQQFREMLGPLLRDNKPSWIASLKLFRCPLPSLRRRVSLWMAKSKPKMSGATRLCISLKRLVAIT